MTRAGRGGRFTPLQVGLIAIVVLVVCVFLAFTKDIPFTSSFEVSAVFKNAPPIAKGTAVRIAGVNIGKVSNVEAVGGDSPAVKVTMKLEDAGAAAPRGHGHQGAPAHLLRGQPVPRRAARARREPRWSTAATPSR